MRADAREKRAQIITAAMHQYRTQPASTVTMQGVAAEAGVGIALGDDCVVEAGLYVTAGTKVTGPDGTQIKARDLSGQSNLLFRRNSLTGAVEVVPWKGDGIALNEALHKND